jgi:hypothetical protein
VKRQVSARVSGLLRTAAQARCSRARPEQLQLVRRETPESVHDTKVFTATSAAKDLILFDQPLCDTLGKQE